MFAQCWQIQNPMNFHIKPIVFHCDIFSLYNEMIPLHLIPNHDFTTLSVSQPASYLARPDLPDYERNDTSGNNITIGDV